MTFTRFDKGEIVGKLEKTPEGYIRTIARVTRTGVFSYRNTDGSARRELRHPDEVFSADSLASLKMIPITNNHPDSRLVTADTAKALSIGFTGENIQPDGKFLMVPITITTADGVSAVENGRKELSLGYEVNLENTPGEYNNDRFDCIQRCIRYNHLAIVNRGRAGPEVSIHMDGEEIDEPREDFNKNHSPVNGQFTSGGGGGGSSGVPTGGGGGGGSSKHQEGNKKEYADKIKNSEKVVGKIAGGDLVGKNVYVSSEGGVLISGYSARAGIQGRAKEAGFKTEPSSNKTVVRMRNGSGDTEITISKNIMPNSHEYLGTREVSFYFKPESGTIGRSNRAGSNAYTGSAYMPTGYDRMDKKDEATNTIHKENSMLIVLDGIEYEGAPEIIKALEKANAALHTANGRVDAMTKDVEVLKANADTANDQLKVLQARNIDGEIADAVKARIALEGTARGIVVADTAEKLPSMTDAEIRAAVITTVFPTAKLDGASKDYLQARFDAAVELKTSPASSDTAAAQREAVLARKTVDGCGAGEKPNSEASRKKYMDEMQNAWKSSNAETPKKK